jgi:hypothetical protein
MIMGITHFSVSTWYVSNEETLMKGSSPMRWMVGWSARSLTLAAVLTLLPVACDACCLLRLLCWLGQQLL